MLKRIGWGVVLLFVLMPALAGADPLKLKLAASVEEQYKDNIFFETDETPDDTEDDTEDDFVTHIAPQIKAGWLTEITDLKLSARADFYNYQENSGLNAVDQSYSGQLGRQWSPRFSTSLSAAYLDDETRERELAETGLLFNDDRRRRQTYGLSGRYLLSELSSLSLSYSFQNEDFDDEMEYDFIVHSIQILMARNLAPFMERCTGRLQMVGRFYEYRRDYGTIENLFGFYPVNIDVNDTQSIDYYSVSLGVAYQWTERFQLTVDLGGRLTRNERSLSNEIEPNPFGVTGTRDKEESESRGFVAMLELVYLRENGQVSLLASHDLEPASGREGATERTTLRLSGNERLTYRWYFNWSAKAYLNRSEESSTVDEDELTVQLQAGLRYGFHPRWYLAAYWRTYWIEDRRNDSEARQNTFSLQLAWNWPMLD